MKYYRHDGVLDIRFTDNEAVALRNWLSHLRPDENGTVAGNLLRILKSFPSMLSTEGHEEMTKHNVSKVVHWVRPFPERSAAEVRGFYCGAPYDMMASTSYRDQVTCPHCLENNK